MTLKKKKVSEAFPLFTYIAGTVSGYSEKNAFQKA